MSSVATSVRSKDSRKAFWLWGWTMLLVVLLSAAPTGGEPRTRLIGSAFDPATTSVVVNPKRPKVTLAAKKAKPADPADGTGSAPPMLAGASAVAEPGTPTIYGPTAFHYAAPARSLSRPLLRSHPPRAPPAP